MKFYLDRFFILFFLHRNPRQNVNTTLIKKSVKTKKCDNMYRLVACPYSNVLDARIRQRKEGEAKEDMAKYIQRRPGRDGCQLAWSLQYRQ